MFPRLRLWLTECLPARSCMFREQLPVREFKEFCLWRRRRCLGRCWTWDLSDRNIVALPSERTDTWPPPPSTKQHGQPS